MNPDRSYRPTYVAINWQIANSLTTVNRAAVVEIPFSASPPWGVFKLFVRVEKVTPMAVAAPGRSLRKMVP